MRSNIKKFITFESLILLVVFCFSFYFRFKHLGSDIFNDDAHFWYERTVEFMSRLKQGEFSETYQTPKPGVTVMWLSGISNELFLNLHKYKFGFKPLIYTAETFPLVHFATKAPLVLTCSFFLILFYFLVEKLFSRKVAFFATIFLSFEPFYIGITRFLHVDGLLSVFMALSALFIVLYLTDTKRFNAALYLSAVSASLAFLTKSQAVFLLLFIPFSFLCDYVISKRKISFYFKKFVLWLTVTVIIFCLLFPAMWVSPLFTLKRILSESIETAVVGRNDWKESLYYLRALPLRISPFSLLGFIFCLFSLPVLFKKVALRERKNLFLILAFIFFYFIQITLPKQKIDRYLMPIIPFIAVIAAYGLVSLLKSTKMRLNYTVMYVLLTFILVIFLTPSVPYFTTFYNPVLSGRATARKFLRFETVGEIYSKAAFYLNEKENPHDLVVVCTYIPQSFRPFFKGKTFEVVETLPEELTLDYVIVPWYDKLPEKYKDRCPLEKEIEFKGLTYWYIYDCRDPAKIEEI